MTTLLGAQLSTFDLETIPGIGGGNPKGHMHGLRVAYGSATTITIESGECRDSTDTYDLTLAALVTVSIATAGAALGLDETTLTATCTTGGNTTGTMSASIWSETPMTNTVRSLTGTISGAGTTITGSSTKFLTECAIGDVLRSATGGARRITAIASDTSLTVVSAFTADPSGTAATLYENLTFWCDTAQSGDKRAVNTITHDGLTITWTTNSTSNGAGRTAKIGVEIASRWFFPWIVYGGSGTTGILSTQRTRPYGVTGYATAWRRCASIPNNASGNFILGYRTGGGSRWTYTYDEPGIDTRTLAGGAATSFTKFDCSLYVPPTTQEAFLRAVVSNGAAARDLDFRANGSSATYGFFSAFGVASTYLSNYGAPIPILGGALEYKYSGAGSTTNVDIISFTEDL